jgi:hypothetical protein
VALIRSITRDDRPARPPRTQVDCHWSVVRTPDGSKLLRLATLGSDERKSEPKPSQIIEIDESIARQLISLLTTEFPGLGRSR